MIILIFQPGTWDLGEVKTFALVASGRATNGGVNETRRWGVCAGGRARGTWQRHSAV